MANHYFLRNHSVTIEIPYFREEVLNDKVGAPVEMEVVYSRLHLLLEKILDTYSAY